MYISIVLACMSVSSYVCSSYGGQKRALNPLGLQLQTVVSYVIGAGNCSLGKTASAPTH